MLSVHIHEPETYPKNMNKYRKQCNGRESNPSLYLGRVESYRWTTETTLQLNLDFILIEIFHFYIQ